MATTRGRRTLLAAATITALTLFTLPMRNESFECCTTHAYGFPLPWWVELGECGHGANWPEQLLYWAGNSLFGLTVAATVTAVWRAVKEARAAEADPPPVDRG